jgi:RNA polymerase sigma-32 factor
MKSTRKRRPAPRASRSKREAGRPAASQEPEPELVLDQEEPELEEPELEEPGPAEIAELEEQEEAASSGREVTLPLERWEGAYSDTEPEAEVAVIPAGRRLPARYDALQAYINQARLYPILTPEEEHELAVRYLETGDLEAARKLVTSNLRLVVKIAHEYRKAYRNLLDLVQEGNIGLMHAVKKFDPYRGVRLSSYAAWWIRAYILKFILANWRLVKIGTTQAQRKLFFNLRKEIERLEAMGIEQPGPRLLAERLEVPEEEVQSMQERLAGSDVSLDAPVRADEAGSASRLDFVTARSAAPDRTVENREFSSLLQEKLRAFGKTLRGRDREIFELRTTAEEPLTLQEIGDRFGITRERARQIERRMMDRLKEYLKQELGDAVEVALDSLGE